MKNYTAIFLTIISGLIFFGGAQAVKAGGEPPANDNLAGAMPLVINQGSVGVTTSNFNSTKETGEPNHAENVGGKSVWFSFTPTATNVFRINTVNNTLDTLLAVYTGNSVDNLQLVGYNDDASSSPGFNGASTVDLMLTAGTTYHIAVDGLYNNGGAGQGNFKIAIIELGIPTQNDLSGAYNLGFAHGGSIAGTTFGATREADEPSHYNATLLCANTVWYKWKPSGNFAVKFELTDDYNSTFAVYSSSSPSATYADLQVVSRSYDYFAFGGSRYRINFFAETNKTYYIVVGGNNVNGNNPIGNFQLKWRGNHLHYSADYEWFDDKATIALYRPSEGRWYSINDFYSYPAYADWGKSGDLPVSADYDGNGATDKAVVRNENGLKTWYVRSAPTSYALQWGLASDKAVTGDFDGDGRADMTVIRNSANGLVWYVRQSSNGALRTFVFGTTGDKPVLGDFDGDGWTEVAVVRNTQNGLVWYMIMSGFENGDEYTQTKAIQFGTTPDVTAVEDFDGDGKTDIGVFRPSTGKWYIRRSGTGELQETQFGASGDKPQPADYDGDGKADLAVFRPSTGRWYFWLSKDNTQTTLDWGVATDIPVSSMNTLSQ
jgi:FG-GAP-like repeat